MKNLKVNLKLIVSFMIVAAMTAAVGITGIVGMTQVDSAMYDMYYKQTVPMPDLGKINELIQRQRAYMREFIIGAAVDDFDLIENAKARTDESRDAMEPYLVSYRATITDPAALAIFDEAINLYRTDFLECVELMYELSRGDDDPADLYRIMSDYTPSVNKIVDNFDLCMELKIEAARDANYSSTELANMMLIIIIIVLIIAVAVGVFFALYISGLISKPMKVLSGYMSKAGTLGIIDMTPEEKRLIPAYAQYKDEIGETIQAAQNFFKHVTHIAEELEKMASGDLTSDIHVLSDDDVLGNSLKRTGDNLNDMFGNISSSTTQVSTGAKQVADGAQSLAQGSTEQAASVQELSASISEIAGKTKENATLAERAASLATSIMQNAETGSKQMDDMMAAVQEINLASQNISKVIKVIDDIAFQTNILALNAAVEAARAGQHGKGFAVVAEEVRNLAAKSADAAKETGDMIQNSMEKAELGSRIAGETAESLTEIVTGITESSALIGDIARSSEEQTSSISQVNIGIDQVAQVVQQNSATAQQSAAASQQMSAQSTVLQELMAQFKIKNSMNNSLPSYSSANGLPRNTEHVDDTGYPGDIGSGDLGKY